MPLEVCPEQFVVSINYQDNNLGGLIRSNMRVIRSNTVIVCGLLDQGQVRY